MNFKGKIASKVFVGEPIPLVPKNFESLAEAEPGSRTVGTIAKLRQSHHDIARYLAYGFDHKRVAAMTGYTPLRIGQLEKAPAMKELIAIYRARIDEKEEEKLDTYIALKTSNMIAAERHIADAIEDLDEAGDLLPIKTALAISADGADRLGYGKKSQVNVNHDFASQLEKAIARSQGRDLKVIEASAKQIEPPRTEPVLLNPPANSRVEPASRPLIRRRA